MLDPGKKYYLEDVIELTGISERNIKFWVAEYHLKVIKEGRKNHYPAQTVLLLNLIKDLSESKFFTTKFVQIQVERCKYPDKMEINGLDELNEITKRMLQYVLEMNNVPQGEEEVTAETKPETVETTPEQKSVILLYPAEKETAAAEPTAPPELIKEEVNASIGDEKPKEKTRMVVDDFAWSTEEPEFQPVPTTQNDSMRRMIKELKSPIITLADKPQEKKHAFWHQLKKILK